MERSGITKILCSTMAQAAWVDGDEHTQDAAIRGMCATGGNLYLVNNGPYSEECPFPIYKYSCSTLLFVKGIGEFSGEEGGFACPSAICTDGTNLYITEDDGDPYYPSLADIQKVLLDGTFVWKVGTQGEDDDEFNVMWGICVG